MCTQERLTCTHTGIDTHVYTHAYRCVHPYTVYTNRNRHTWIHTGRKTQAYTCVHTLMYTHVHTDKCMHTHMYKHTQE